MAREFSMKTSGCLAVSGFRGPYIQKASQIDTLALNCDSRDVSIYFRLIANALHLNFIVRSYRSVATILMRLCGSYVFPSVVTFFQVFMINLTFWPFSGDVEKGKGVSIDLDAVDCDSTIPGRYINRPCNLSKISFIYAMRDTGSVSPSKRPTRLGISQRTSDAIKGKSVATFFTICDAVLSHLILIRSLVRGRSAHLDLCWAAPSLYARGA